MHGLFGLFSPRYPRALVGLLQSNDYRLLRFTRNFLTANDVRPYDAEFVATSTGLTLLRSCWMVYMAAAGFAVWLVIASLKNVVPGGAAFAGALIIGAPLLLYFFLVLLVLVAKILRFLRSPKRAGKDLLCRMLEAQVKRLRAKNDFKVVAIVGSVGKTSTKLAIAHTLQPSRRVIFQEGNYNDRLTVPLVLFGHSLPGLLNLPAWVKILLANERIVRRSYPYDVAVLELGVDGPGQMKDFAYLAPDLAVVTALTPEHMEYFKTLDAVAHEELAVAEFSGDVIINQDDCPEQYFANLPVTTYGTGKTADVRVVSWKSKGVNGVSLKINTGDHVLPLESPMFGRAGAKITAAAVAVALKLGLTDKEITKAVAELPPTPGRMQVLGGQKGSVLLDDTYNASPAAVKAGLDVLYELAAPKRIAILGSMNELGDYAPAAHQEVGDYCDPKKLDLVVTIGKLSEELLAPVARQKGCTVETFLSPYEAGRRLQSELGAGIVVLGEGSQNGVFAEEALKLLLENPEDSCKLVRQSTNWLNVKRRQFKDS